MENYLMLNGKKIMLVEEQVKILTNEEEKEDVWNPKMEESYYYISTTGNIVRDLFENTDSDIALQKNANCCTDVHIMEARTLQETLNRLLWKFSLQNGWTKEKQKDLNQTKYAIAYNQSKKKFVAITVYDCMYVGTAYFTSSEIAQKAIHKIVDPFIKEHPELLNNC